MSFPVARADLGLALQQYAEGYLLTVTPDATTRAVAVRPSVVDGQVVVGAGRSSSANVAVHPHVTVLCPPTTEKGFTLLIDGTATVAGDEIRIEWVIHLAGKHLLAFGRHGHVGCRYATAHHLRGERQVCAFPASSTPERLSRDERQATPRVIGSDDTRRLGTTACRDEEQRRQRPTSATT